MGQLSTRRIIRFSVMLTVIVLHFYVWLLYHRANTLDTLIYSLSCQLCCMLFIFIEVATVREYRHEISCSTKLRNLPKPCCLSIVDNPQLTASLRDKVLVVTDDENTAFKILNSRNECIHCFHGQVIAA